MTRPKLDPETKRSIVLTVKVNDAENESIDNYSEAKKMSRSKLLRLGALEYIKRHK